MRNNINSNTRKRYSNTKCGQCQHSSFWYEFFQCDKLPNLQYARFPDEEFLREKSEECGSFLAIASNQLLPNQEG